MFYIRSLANLRLVGWLVAWLVGWSLTALSTQYRPYCTFKVELYYDVHDDAYQQLDFKLYKYAASSILSKKLVGSLAL